MTLRSVSAILLLSLFVTLSVVSPMCAQTTPEEIPVEHRDRYNKMDLWLDQKISEWKPTEYKPISFCAHHLLASEQMINFTDGSFDLPFLEMLEETGIDCVRLSIFPYNYEKYPQRYDDLIAKIKEKKLKLMVAYMVGNLPQGTVGSFKEYKKKELDFTAMFIKKYNPDYYAVVTEPITMEKRIKLGFRLSDEEWIDLVKDAADLVKEINPGVKTIAAVNTEAEQFDLAKKLAAVKNLDIIGFQLYGSAGMYKEYKGWAGTGDVVTQTIDYVKSKGKDTWITETWLSIPSAETWNGTKSSNTYFNDPMMAPLDAKWIKLITYYAEKYAIKGVSPFFTGKFISYPSNSRDEQKNNLLRDFKTNNRTLPFYAYRDVIKEFKNNVVNPDGNNNSLINRNDIKKPKEKLSEIRIASVYDNITDGIKYGRSIGDTVALLKETNTDFVFRGFFKWIWPVFDSPNKIPDQLVKLSGANEQTLKWYSRMLGSQGYYYENLKKYISAIKESIPDLIFCGAIPAQCIGKLELNPITQRVYSLNDAWGMSFDPQKWNLRYNDSPVTKEQFQKWFYGIHPYGGTDAKDYDWHKAEAFFPDITNADFQELLVSFAKKQIDCGADAIWIDGLPLEAIFDSIFKQGTQALNRDLSIAASKIVDAIHEYGRTKGIYVYVGYWANPFGLIKGDSYVPAKVDFVTIAPSKEEVLNKKIDENKWGKEVGFIRKIYGDIPIFAFIDWAFDDSQTVAFSQKLNKEEQNQVLEEFDKAFENIGVKFVYPVHGGYMGRGEVTTKLSFGKDRIYDSLAPEFQTYETIKELSRNKSRNSGNTHL